MPHSRSQLQTPNTTARSLATRACGAVAGLMLLVSATQSFAQTTQPTPSTEPATAPAAMAVDTTNQQVPLGFEGASVIYKPDARVPLDLSFRDEAGNTVKLQQYFHGKPVIVAMVYYNCPMLCGLTMNGLLEGVKPLGLTMGKDYEIVTISFDPREDANKAAAKKKAYMEEINKPDAVNGWHFLTSLDYDSPRTLGDALGFGFKYDPKADQYLHQAAIYICMPDGRVSRAVPDVHFDTDMLHDSLVDASQGKLGSRIFKFAQSCGIYSYDSASGKYVMVARNVMRLGGVLTVLVLGSFISLLLYQDNRKRKTVPQQPVA